MEAVDVRGAVHPDGCLFCRKHDGGFTSLEHIFSEGLGNLDQKVVPAGVVCDRCNNGPLAQADRALIDFEPIQLLRAERGLGTRSGRAVVSRWKEGDIGFTAPQELSIFGQGPSPVEQVGPNEFRLNATTMSPFKPKRGMLILRALWKIVIESIYLDSGAELAYAPVLDAARREVIGMGDGVGWMVAPKDHSPLHGRLRASYHRQRIDGGDAFPTLIDIFGICFYTDPVRRHLSHEYIETILPWEANVWVFPFQKGGS